MVLFYTTARQGKHLLSCRISVVLFTIVFTKGLLNRVCFGALGLVVIVRLSCNYIYIYIYPCISCVIQDSTRHK